MHIRGCSHLQTTDPSKLIAADDRDRAELELCSECDKEVRGIGRVEYLSLDAAFEALKFPVENRPRMRDIASGVEFDRVWAPQSRSYVAAGFRDERPVAAYINRGFVDVHLEEGGYERHEMPTYARGAGGRLPVQALQLDPGVCRTCSIQLPANLVYDNCD